MKHDRTMLTIRKPSPTTEFRFIRYIWPVLTNWFEDLWLARSPRNALREGSNGMPDQIEVPSDEQVIAALHELHGAANARALCARLMEKGHGRLASQLAIQRTAERGKITMRDDWTFSAVELEAA